MESGILPATNGGVTGKGRLRQYGSKAEKQAAYRARMSKRSASFDLSPEILYSLAQFMARRVDSSNPSETKSQVVERALKAFLRKR